MHGINYYESKYFSVWKGEKMIGEVDPDYMYFEHAIERIRKHLALDKIKFIFIFRNPVDRAFSHYLMTLRRGLEPLSFEDALEAEENRICRDRRSRGFYSYIDRGFYYNQVQRFLEYVDISQMFFMLWEDLAERPRKSMQTLFNFLDISTEYVPPNISIKFHQAVVPRSMFLLRRLKKDGVEKEFVRRIIPWEGLRKRVREKVVRLNLTEKIRISPSLLVRKKLSDIYREENQLLAGLIGRDLSGWGYNNLLVK
jgi:hypothetical protein